MKWNPPEIAQAATLCRAMQNDTCSRSTVVERPLLTLRVSDAGRLKDDLSFPNSYGLLFMRHLFEALTFDARGLSRWRMDHKLVQAHILNHYFPGAVPVTLGLRRAVSPAARDDIKRQLTEITARGFLVKATLGYGSAERGDVNQLQLAFDNLTASSATLPNHLCDENFIAQEKISIEREFRVHSFEDLVIEDLTFLRNTPRAAGSHERSGANAFVQRVLDALPNTLTKGALYGWDIALTTTGGFRVIEANPAGCYSCFVPPGFHCSGYLTLPFWAPPTIARLLRFIRRRYQVSISVIPDADRNTREQVGYWWIAQCADLVEKRLPRPASGEVGTEDIAPASHEVDLTLSPEQNIFKWALAFLGASQEEAPGSTASRSQNITSQQRTIAHRGHGSLEVSVSGVMTQTERALSEMWSSLFSISQIGLDDDFVNLGGDSMLAMRCAYRLHEVFGVELPVDIFFAESATVKEIAKIIDERRKEFDGRDGRAELARES